MGLGLEIAGGFIALYLMTLFIVSYYSLIPTSVPVCQAHFCLSRSLYVSRTSDIFDEGAK